MAPLYMWTASGETTSCYSTVLGDAAYLDQSVEYFYL